MNRKGRVRVAIMAAIVFVIVTTVLLETRSYIGSDEDVASVKVAVPKLLQADTAVGRLPDQADRPLPAVVFSAESVARRAEAIRGIWAPSAVREAIEDWEGGMTTVFDGESLYDDNRFEVTKWLGVRVHGRTAVADFRGREVYHDHDSGTDGWFKDQVFRHRVKLWRSSSSSERWYLLDHQRDVDDEYRP